MGPNGKGVNGENVDKESIIMLPIYFGDNNTKTDFNRIKSRGHIRSRSGVVFYKRIRPLIIYICKTLIIYLTSHNLVITFHM